jgi:hypothetical protein
VRSISVGVRTFLWYVLKVKFLCTPQVIRGSWGMAPLFLKVTMWGIGYGVYTLAAVLTGKSAPDSHRAGLRKRKLFTLSGNELRFLRLRAWSSVPAVRFCWPENVLVTTEEDWVSILWLRAVTVTSVRCERLIWPVRHTAVFTHMPNIRLFKKRVPWTPVLDWSWLGDAVFSWK